MLRDETKPEQYLRLKRIEFRETSIFLYQHLPVHLSEVKFKFLRDKKGPTKGFYLEVWKIASVFFYHVYLLNYHNCFYICEGLYLRASPRQCKLKRD